MAGPVEEGGANTALTTRQLKLRRKTELQRVRRHDEKQTISALQEMVLALEKDLAAMTIARPKHALVAWHEVAEALNEDLEVAKNENQRLKRHRQRLLDVIRGITKWIASVNHVSGGPQCSESASNNLGMKCITLTANAACRLHGMDWMTLILYHNTDTMLQKYRFWSDWSSVVRADGFVDVSNVDDIQHVWRLQVDMPVSMATALPFVREHVLNHLNAADIMDASVVPIDPELVKRISPGMSYIRRLYQTARGNNIGFNVMYREFQEDARIVFVGQSIQDDRFAVSPAELRDKSMTWIVLTALTPSTTRLSILSMSSFRFSSDGKATIADEADYNDIPRAPHEVDMDLETYSRRFNPSETCQEVIVAWSQYLSNAALAAETSMRPAPSSKPSQDRP